MAGWPTWYVLLYLRKGYIRPLTLPALFWSPGGYNWVISDVSSTQPLCLRLWWATVWQYVVTACVCVSCSTANRQIMMGAGIVRWGLWDWMCVCETESFYWLHVACLRLDCVAGRLWQPKPRICCFWICRMYNCLLEYFTCFIKRSWNERVSKNEIWMFMQ